MYNLVFSDGTGRSGADSDGTSTNVYKLYLAADKNGAQTCFYDAGVGTNPDDKDVSIWRRIYNWLAKATGLGITLNVRECYDFLMQAQGPGRPGRPIGLFGFSRGAYTVRSVGGVLALCGLPHHMQDGIDLNDKDNRDSVAKRRALAKQAVNIYTTGFGGRNKVERERLAKQFRQDYKCADAFPHVIGVFDTVAALGFRGISTLSTPLKHAFHDQILNVNIQFGLQALSTDENRTSFKPVLWADKPPKPGQTIDQQWFPGVHSDIGGGYKKTGLSDFAMTWMADQCRQPAIDVTFKFAAGEVKPDIVGKQHDERDGWFGKLWREGLRTEFVEKLDVDDDRLCDPIEMRFKKAQPPYRPEALEGHPRVDEFY